VNRATAIVTTFAFAFRESARHIAKDETKPHKVTPAHNLNAL